MKSQYRHVIFDLDGTLSDSREGIFKAYHYTAGRMQLKLPTEDKMPSLIGPSLQQGFQEVFGLSDSEIKQAVALFREYYGERGLFENKLYEGIRELLEELGQADACLYVATAKYQLFAERVLRYFEIYTCFREIAGADYGGSTSKTQQVAGLIRRNGITDPAEVVVVGDTRFDIDAAAELALDSIGVSYGFSTYEQMEQWDPDYIARDVAGLRQILLPQPA